MLSMLFPGIQIRLTRQRSRRQMLTPLQVCHLAAPVHLLHIPIPLACFLANK